MDNQRVWTDMATRSSTKRLLILLCLQFALCSLVNAQSAAEAPDLISKFRLQHGEGQVTADLTLNRIAQAQANAMASRDVLSHDALGPFNSRVASAGAGRAAENIAYGYEAFPKTLNQWIGSSEHRKNLLMHGGTRVGVASAKSPTSRRTYWAMVIAGEYERPKAPAAKVTSAARKPKARTEQACRIKILSICL